MAGPKGTLTFDIETFDADLLYSMPPAEFVRLMGYAWGDGDVVLTTDLSELREQIRRARWIIGHNINSFDLRAVFGIQSDIPMQLTDEGRVYDTWTHAALVNPCPHEYINRFGERTKEPGSNKIQWTKKWFGLDEQAYQLGVAGKTNDLRDIAFKFGDPALPKKDRIKDGFGKIPLDDPEYQDYLVGDVKASRAVGRALLRKGPLNTYALREQRIESRKATISSNGFRVNRELAQARVDELATKRAKHMTMLVEKHDFPTAGKQPWRSDPGKRAILQALTDVGVTEHSHPSWPRTKNGALSLGGGVLLNLTEGTEAKELGQALAELMGQRSLAQLALDSCHPDGRVHPDITMLQKSGRWSTTDPGLTVWTSRGDNAVEKAYFVADNDDEVVLEIDLSNADARAVAAYSGDTKYAERFAPGADGHLINAWAAWGRAEVGEDKHDPKTAQYRQLAKPGGHGWGYRIGAGKLAATWGKPVHEAKKFLDNMNRAFHRVVKWQDSVTWFASRHGYVMNPWGRRMPVERGREYTQAPALLGQSATREIICDALLRMPYHIIRRVKAQIHDALVFSIPRKNWEACRDYLLKLVESYMDPAGGQRIEFPAGAGPAGNNWHEASHD